MSVAYQATSFEELVRTYEKCTKDRREAEAAVMAWLEKHDEIVGLAYRAYGTMLAKLAAR